MNHPSNRLPLIDAFKAIAAQLIVLHHLASYGPLSVAARQLVPGTADWLFDYGRMAVQVFLVIGGFLAARGLSASGQALAGSPLPLIWKRYVRLVIPYLAAIAFAIACSAIAHHWIDDPAIPARATFKQWLAHAFMLQNLLGFNALSAGLWYVAIDFQLFALMALLLWAGHRRYLAPALVLGVAASSLFWFNRDQSWDHWALYFFGSYGLALCVALALGFGRRSGVLESWPNVRPLAFLGRISFSIFLVHFPIYLLANTLFVKLGLTTPGAAMLGILGAWAASIAGGTLFYRWVESPAASQRIAVTIGWPFGKLREQANRLPGLLTLIVRRA